MPSGGGAFVDRAAAHCPSALPMSAFRFLQIPHLCSSVAEKWGGRNGGGRTNHRCTPINTDRILKRRPATYPASFPAQGDFQKHPGIVLLLRLQQKGGFILCLSREGGISENGQPRFLRLVFQPHAYFLSSFPRRREPSKPCGLNSLPFLDPRLRGDDVIRVIEHSM
jgi:hypothetical protein